MRKIKTHSSFTLIGYVEKIQGLSLLVSVNSGLISLGVRCYVFNQSLNKEVEGEVVGFDGVNASVMLYHDLNGISPGAEVRFEQQPASIYPDTSWQGRILNGLGEPVDGKPITQGENPYFVKNHPPSAHTRAKVEHRIDLGVRAVNVFLTTCEGQRMGIFAGSGVGKSVLLSMLVKFSKADIAVIGLIGERGRELRDFIDDALGEEGLKRSVLVVATSDESALMRRQAAYTTLTIAEYFRDQGLSVLCVMDSVTRFAMSQREIGLSVGEPPTTKGYTPSVFAELPKLLERAGPGVENSGNKAGYITGYFTVLVDGDDHNEPIADAVRGILDGHIVLDRNIASRNHFPAINILKSISRTVPACLTPEERPVVAKARRLMTVYEDMADMIRLGAYREGSNAEVDEAIRRMPDILQFTAQDREVGASLEESFAELSRIMED